MSNWERFFLQKTWNWQLQFNVNPPPPHDLRSDVGQEDVPLYTVNSAAEKIAKFLPNEPNSCQNNPQKVAALKSQLKHGQTVARLSPILTWLELVVL
jgi:hypothetical protein